MNVACARAKRHLQPHLQLGNRTMQFPRERVLKVGLGMEHGPMLRELFHDLLGNNLREYGTIVEVHNVPMSGAEARSAEASARWACWAATLPSGVVSGGS